MYTITNIYVLAAFGTIGGALFGFDVSSMSAWIDQDQYLDYFNHPSADLQGGITASMSGGSFLGALCAGFIADKWGRRYALMLASIIWVIGAAVQCSSQNFGHLIAGRIISGLSVGTTSSQVCVYLAELAPGRIRGRIVGIQQWAIEWGILIMFLVAWGCTTVSGPAAFRIAWGVQAVPGFILFGALLFFPESPRWLAGQERWEECLQVLAAINAKGDQNDPLVQAEYMEVQEAVHIMQESKGVGMIELFGPKVWKRTMCGCSVQMWQHGDVRPGSFSRTVIAGGVSRAQVEFQICRDRDSDEHHSTIIISIASHCVWIVDLLFGFSHLAKYIKMPVTDFKVPEKYKYLNGFNNYHETEAVDGALPIGANNPQKAPLGLYNEKLSGTAFTSPRHENQQTWLYRILPASAHSAFEPRESSTYNTNPENKSHEKIHQIPNQLRWDPFDLDETVDWVHSLHLVAGAGDPTMKTGLGIFIYAAGKDMSEREAFYSADGDFLIVPQHGVLDIQTELGNILVRPNEICVIPRGIRYRVTLPHGPVRGYILELYQNHFTLPELGPMGSNGLANARDFQAPVASFIEDNDGKNTYTILSKFAGHLFAAEQNHTPFDVVAWHGNYYPYKYDLGRFNTIGSISYDHPDPSIFTVLTAQSDHLGTAIADFVIFPPRWLVQEDTFRPPWYHRNTMSEFMGLIGGEYDAKTGGGFQPAGASLHNIMSAHGPDAATHEKASNAELKPMKVGEGSMAFMFESCLMVGVTDWGLKKCAKVQPDYNAESWEPLKPHFKRPTPARIKNDLPRDADGEIGDKGQVPHWTS